MQKFRKRKDFPFPLIQSLLVAFHLKCKVSGGTGDFHYKSVLSRIHNSDKCSPTTFPCSLSISLSLSFLKITFTFHLFFNYFSITNPCFLEFTILTNVHPPLFLVHFQFHSRFHFSQSLTLFISFSIILGSMETRYLFMFWFEVFCQINKK